MEKFSDLIMIIIVIGFISIIGIFSYLMIMDLGTNEILPPLTNQSIEILQDTGGNQTQLINFISTQEDNFNNFSINLDLIFLSLYIGVIAITGIVAYYLPPLSKMEFMTFLFFGIMFILYGLNVIEQIFSYLVQVLFLETFDPSKTNLPIFTWFVSNYILSIIIHISALLLINQFSYKPEENFDPTRSSNNMRVER